MRVKMLTSLSGAHEAFLTGETLSIDETRGQAWIDRGIAEPAHEPEDQTETIAALRIELEIERAARLAAESALAEHLAGSQELPLPEPATTSAPRRGRR